MITIIVLYLLWCLYSVYEGWREGMYFFYKVNATITQQKTFGGNEHVEFSIQRATVIALLSVSMFRFCLWGQALFAVVSMAAAFPFFHDGMYYLTRNKMNKDVYPKKWWDQSTTSTSLMDHLHLLNPTERTIYLGLSLLIIFFYCSGAI